ncbi:MAG: hypothetical protein V4710_05765 [Verrucomicrobiota bacterium]
MLVSKFLPLALLMLAGTLSHAAENILLTTVIKRTDSKGRATVLSAPRFLTEAGQHAILKTNGLELDVLPSIAEDGSIQLSSVFTRHGAAGKSHIFSSPRLSVLNGKKATLTSGDLIFELTPKIIKAEPEN